MLKEFLKNSKNKKIVLNTAIIFSFLLICTAISSSLNHKNENIEQKSDNINSKSEYEAANLKNNSLSSKLKSNNQNSKKENKNTEQKNKAKKHIYEKAIVKPLMNGFRNKKIGEYGLIYAISSDCNEKALADLYFNYFLKKKLNYMVVIYADKSDNSGVYIIDGVINTDAKFNKDEFGDYSLGDTKNSKYYAPVNENTLKLVE